MGGQSRINTHKWEMSSYKILSWPNMIMHTVGGTDIQSTTCSARGKQYCWQDGSSRQKINLLCKISKFSYILLFDYGLWALPSNPVSHVSSVSHSLPGRGAHWILWQINGYNQNLHSLCLAMPPVPVTTYTCTYDMALASLSHVSSISHSLLGASFLDSLVHMFNPNSGTHVLSQSSKLHLSHTSVTHWLLTISHANSIYLTWLMLALYLFIVLNISRIFTVSILYLYPEMS